MIHRPRRPHFGEQNVEMARKGGFAKQATVGSDLTPDNEVTATELQWPSLHNVCVVISLKICQCPQRPSPQCTAFREISEFTLAKHISRKGMTAFLL